MNIRFFTVNDLFLAPVCLAILYFILKRITAKYSDPIIRKVYMRAFAFKMVFVMAFALVTEFYFGGGDTGLYFQGIDDLRTAIATDPNNLAHLLFTTHLSENDPLTPFFLYDNYSYDITYNYMLSPSNFFVPKLGLLPSFIFFNSYLCICMCLAFFAMGGSLRLFKLFYHYYPSARREIALATVFLPSVAFWSSGLLKDTICFASVGFMVYGIFTIFVRKTNYVSSIFWIILSGYLLYVIKTYIFLVLLMAVAVWIFAESNKRVKDRSLRILYAAGTFMFSAVLGYFLLQYFTAGETVQQYQLENIVSSAENQRDRFASIESASEGGSYYAIDASNPFLLVVNSIIASFFRPFPWEARSAAAVLSAIEALGVLLLTVSLVFRRNTKSLSLVFNEPRILFCFVFAIVFAIGVGASTANFGALSRYKIPCMPFYLLMITLLYNRQGLTYPAWFNRLLGTMKF